MGTAAVNLIAIIPMGLCLTIRDLPQRNPVDNFGGQSKARASIP
jgi:hypothetical protein